jgi:cellulose synthase/poly-beta-1,6-N-acetylglucosamine synthase-like glycosyltransferase
VTTLLSTALAVALVAAVWGLHLLGGYATVLALLAVPPRRRHGDGAASAALPRIALLVVAHDEENVVGRSVASLVAQAYPKERFAVFVVADNCTDDTARVAERAGARVFPRASGQAEGKTAALAHGVHAVASEGGFDAVAIFDADNVADPGYLAAVGPRLAAGERVVQGFVDAENPRASWVAGSSALGFWALAALTQAPRERLGLSAPLMGTGFAMRLDDCLRLHQGAGALADDLELGCRLALDGVRVAYERAARTVDEKPVELGVAVAQRHRWMQGRWAVASRYLPRLLRAAVDPARSGIQRLRAFDMGMQLVLPSLLFTGVALAGAASLLLLLERLAPETARVGRFAAPSVSVALAALYYAVPALGIARFAPPSYVWTYYFLQPFYLALSLPLAVSGWFRRHERTWRRTPHGA